jgi:glycosyltransferase involved in cell wall biosynthesis
VIPALNTVVHNEADRIVGLLEHAATYCDELVVVDQDSTDGTGDLARDFGAKVVWDQCRGFSELSYQLAADNTENQWIVLLDADETIFPEKVLELVALDERWDGARLPRATYINGELWGTGPDRQIRYFRQGAVRYATGLHTYNTMMPVKALYCPPPSEPWIRHWKTSTEQQADDRRYDEIRQTETV